MRILAGLVAVACALGIIVVGFGAWLLGPLVGDNPSERQRWRDGRL